MTSGGGEGYLPQPNPRLDSNKHWGYIGGQSIFKPIPPKLLEGSDPHMTLDPSPMRSD